MRHTLLLQGPVGPFFDRWAKFLQENSDRKIWKIHFNRGDAHFYHQGNSFRYGDSFPSWPSFFRNFVQEHKITEVFLCGDCRPYHRSILPICQESSIDAWVFEEGYLRSHYITLERGGVNAFSDDYSRPLAELRPSLPLPQNLSHRKPSTPFFPLVLNVRYYAFLAVEKYGTLLGNALSKISHFFLGQSHSQKGKKDKGYLYQHYRSLSPMEILRFLRAFGRKLLYAPREHRIRKRFRERNGRFLFIVPLQIAGDSQIMEHSDFPSIEAFIRQVLHSFAKAASKNTCLVFKHHPLDRGHCHYGKFIEAMRRQCNLAPQRVLYVHTTPLSFFWPRALGCVTINSTSGLSALQSGIPTFCLGRCLYAREGITHRGSLDSFWRHPQRPQEDKVLQLADYWKSHVLIQTTFYRPPEHDLWDCIPPYLRTQLGLVRGQNRNDSILALSHEAEVALSTSQQGI
ncbi:MAG: hypothetical protein LBD54_03050 [Puniceicoccales bacterium]|nr:hypothetical protein [Puniceicoccales bacterium]